MKSTYLVAAFALSLSGLAYAAGDHDHGHGHKALHGGIVVEAKHLDFELVAKPGSLTLFVRDHGKPASTEGATAKMTMLNGTDKLELALAPAGENTLEAKGHFAVAKGTKAVALVSLPGKRTSNVRFAIH